ncbi:alanine racemase [Planctomycetota bacterium]
MENFRVWAEINLERLRENYSIIRRSLPGAIAVMGVVKADGYGHGAVPISRFLGDLGIDALGVGDSLEALELRDAGIETPIYILGALAGAELAPIVEYDIIPTVHSYEVAGRLEQEAQRQRKLLQVNVIIDTGMGRLGVKPGEAIGLITRIHESHHLHLEGISTHFPSAGLGDLDFTGFQISNFNRIIQEAEKKGIAIPSRHAASSAAIFSMTDSLFNMVRPGIALYGINPDNLDMAQLGLQPVLSLKSQIVFIKNVPGGTSIGYNRTYFTKRATKIATVPVGYNDGYRFAFSNRVDVLVRGRRRPQVGRVSMDYSMVDLGPDSNAEVGDEVVLIGESGSEQITIEELAGKAGTIPYEISTGLGKRVLRIYN